MTTKHLLRNAVLAIAALTTTTATAQFSTFPPLTKPGTATTERSMQRVSPNKDKESGILMYAATSADGTMYNSWVSLRSKNASSLTRYFSWIEYTDLDDVYRTNLQPATGAYNPEDGKYYLMLTFVYDCLWNAKVTFNYIPQKWFSIDLANGATTPVELADLNNWSKEQGWLSYSQDPNAPHWGLWMDMSFDPIDGTMYALAQSEETLSEENPFHSAIMQVSLADGNYRVKKELRGKYYLGMTYDLDGKLYAARWTTDASNNINGSVIVELDRDSFEETRVVSEIKKDGTPFKLCYNGTMDIDRATGDLYYAGADFDTGRQSMFKIDPKSGECTYLSAFSYDNITGMHIPYEAAANRTAPARVNNIQTEFAADGSNSITIKWTNPTTKWNLEELTAMDGVKIYRDDKNSEPIAVVRENATPGAAASYVDNGATQGLHTYYLVPFNENGDGVSDSIVAFVGHDVPDAPLNVDGYGEGAYSLIQWDAPKTGLHDGWFDKSTVTYRVTRSDGVVVAENDAIIVNGENSFYALDNMLNDAPMMMYSYTVTASNADGEGGSGVSREWMAGSAYHAPYIFDFQATPTVITAFKGYNPAGYSSWTYDNMWRCAWILETNSTAKYDEYLLSPEIQLQAGHTYRVRWNMEFEQPYNKHTFELTHGATENGQTAFCEREFDETITGATSQTTQLVGEFTAEADGKQFLGLHVTTENAQWDYVRVKGLEIEEVLGTDLQAKAIDGFPRINRGKTQDYYVTVYNSGTTDMSGFKVQTGYVNRKGEFVALGELTYDETLPGGASKIINVPTTADYESGTQFDLSAHVSAEGDEYAGNDVCSQPVLVSVDEIEDAAGFNGRFMGSVLDKGAEGYGDTNIPFSTYSPFTTTITIYPASTLVCSETGPLEISRIGFPGTAMMNIAPCDMEIYLGTTDMEKFDGTTSMDPTQGLQKVFDGKSTGMTEGFDGLSANFDTPYVYDTSKNLVVSIKTHCTSGAGGFNIFWSSWDRLSRSQSLKSDAEVWDNPQYNWVGMPDMHFAAKTYNSLDSVYGAEGLSVKVNGRTAYINGNAVQMAVYDMSGRILGTYNVSGRSSVSLNVPAGIYLIKVADATGNGQTLKAVVR